MKEEYQLSKCERFKKGIYDSEKKAFLGRTFKSWALIFVFYVIAYSLLAGFFMGMLSVFMYGFLDWKTPRLTGYQSILNLNPGVSFSPRLSPLHSFLHFTNYPSSVNEHYLVKAKELLDSYKRTEHNAACPNDVPVDSFPEVPCRFPTETLGECNDPEGAIAKGTPCVYIKLNTVYGWLPELANVTEFPTISIRCRGQPFTAVLFY
ncbi:unnamed protein product [Dicrocoelium dendriticum]|nr:unnamed protein product [Dicrocoelium dendriticum]